MLLRPNNHPIRTIIILKSKSKSNPIFSLHFFIIALQTARYRNLPALLSSEDPSRIHERRIDQTPKVLLNLLTQPGIHEPLQCMIVYVSASCYCFSHLPTTVSVTMNDSCTPERLESEEEEKVEKE